MDNKQYLGAYRSEHAPGKNTLNFEFNFVLKIYVFESGELEKACFSNSKSIFELSIVI
jgi:hypothetical protein